MVSSGSKFFGRGSTVGGVVVGVGKDGLAGVDGTRAIVVVVVVGGGTTWLMRGDTVGGGRRFDSVDEFTTKFRVTTCEFTMVV